jgi:hypothetical protein
LTQHPREIREAKVRVRVADVEEQNHDEKSKGRNPKSEINARLEIQIKILPSAAFQFRASVFWFLPDFGIRPSDFIFRASHPRH